MFEYRVTKYDPELRDHMAYLREEWTTFSDIGQSFNGVVLTESEYQRVEDAYATVAIAFLREANVSSLTVCGLENQATIPLTFEEGTALSLAQVDRVVRRMLREHCWCRLEGKRAFVHIGWDYYMYIGVPVRCSDSISLARQLGLFSEPYESPYRG